MMTVTQKDLREYDKNIEAIAKEIAKEVGQGQLDRDDLYDRIWEEADGSHYVIYTHASLIAIVVSDNWAAIDEYADDVGGMKEVIGDSESFTNVIMKAAFFAVKADITDAVERELD